MNLFPGQFLNLGFEARDVATNDNGYTRLVTLPSSTRLVTISIIKYKKLTSTFLPKTKTNNYYYINYNMLLLQICGHLYDDENYNRYGFQLNHSLYLFIGLESN